MPPDCYKIEVIHYLNPHQIWIEVRDPSVVKDEFIFEQIGVYGLLPLDKTLNILTDDLKVLKCEEWLPAATAVIKDSLEESDEVWFSPTYIDKRTSIFDDNIHKYGEIIFKTKDGKLKKLSKKLIKSGFAYNNVGEFHEKLGNSQLKTKLSTTKTQEVIRNLENYCLGHKDKPKNMWKKSVKEQTSVSHMSQNFDLSLTESNLEKHNNEIIKETLKHKHKDFALCKDVDNQSLGRANCKMKSTTETDKQVQKSQFLLQKLLLSKKLSNLSKTERLNQIHSGIVKFLAADSNVKYLNQTNESESTSEHNTSSEIDAVGAKENKQNIMIRKLKQISKLEKAKKSVPGIRNQESECDVNKVESTFAAEVGHLLETPKNFENDHPVEDFKIEQKHIKKYLFKKSIDETDSSGNPFEEETTSGNQFEEETRSCNQFGEKTKSGNHFELKTRSGNQFEEETRSRNQFGENTKSGNHFELKTRSGNQLVEKKSGDQYEGKRRSGNHFEEKSGSAHQIEERKSGYHIEEKKSCDKFKEEKDHTRKTPRRSGKPTDNRNFRRIAFGPPGLDPKFFKIQVIKPLGYEDELNKKKEMDIERVEKSEKRDCMYGYVDSDVDVKITNKKTLENYLRKGNSIEKENEFVKRVINDVKSVKKSEAKDNSVNSNARCEIKQDILKSCPETNCRDNLVEISNKKALFFDDENDSEMNERDNRIEYDIKYNQKKIQTENELVKSGVGIHNSNNSINVKKSSSLIKQKLNTYYNAVKHNSSFSSSNTSNKDSSSDVATNNIAYNKENDDDNIEKVIENLNLKYKDDNISKLEDKPPSEVLTATKLKNNVNPFKNVDPNISVFVDKLVTPVLMVHSKHDKRLEPIYEMCDVYFNSHIKNILQNMSVERPMMLQSISWNVILRGYSLFMISPMGSGKTLGYLPAVCRLVIDSELLTTESGGPMCIIVCATARSVTDVEKMARIFLEKDKKVLACYAGVDNFHITTTLLNGCDLLIATPSALVRLLQTTDFGLDLRRLSTFVLDDCERLSNVYADEIKFFTYKIKEMLKLRANKELKVQYVVASRIWCDFMEPLAKKVPDTVICIGAFQECVLYSKTNTSVALVKKENKVDSVFNFLSDINASKRTVIVCQSNEEVSLLEKALKKSNHTVFSCNKDMTIHDLFNLSVSWAEYSEPLIGPILICCDCNLIHMNITDAHNLIHYSMPPLFSMFCKRFSVLNDNYPSIFKANNEIVKIKVLLGESNVEQLPKILNFIKRCTDNVPSVLDEISSNVLKEKDLTKAKKYYPICDNLLTLGYCPDFYNCQERHTILKDYDTPKDWLPKEGIITCKVLHYHSATLLSARILSCTVNGTTTNYPQTYNKLSLKMGMYYSKESNRKLHGTPEIGDICATSIKLNFYARCQVLKILSRYERGNPNNVLVKLIDEERLEVTRDIYLYYLPDELKDIESRVAHVRLANIEPKDKDITFSELARDRLKNLTEMDTELFIRGKISLTLGNCIFVNTLEVCQHLTSLNEVVVKHNLKQELLEHHAIPNPEHLSKLEKLCTENGLIVKEVKNELEPKIPHRKLPKGTWAHLERDSLSSVFFASGVNPDKFFVRLDKFESCMVGLLQDIQKYVDTKPTPCATVKEGQIVLAKFPADDTYERARIDLINEEIAQCFFVDQGDWKEIPLNDLIPITEQFINKLPFQAIECRLVGIQPMGNQWTDFSTNWFIDSCYNDKGDLKCLFVKYFTKEPAEFTNGHKYSVALIDTSTEQDIIINQLMIDFNLAKENLSEIKCLDDLDFNEPEQKHSDTEEDVYEETVPSPTNSIKEMRIDDTNKKNIVPAENNILFKAPLRSVPLVNSDNESDDSDKWDANIDDDCMNLFPALKNLKDLESKMPKVHTENTLKSTELDKKEAEIVELDSDDLTSPDNTIVYPEKSIATNKDMNKEKHLILDMKTEEDGNKKPVLESKAESKKNKRSVIELRAEIAPKRRPKLVWRQNKTNVTIKIQLIGADNYNLDIGDRILVFSADVNDIEYGFELELCGVVHKERCSHVNKGQYILVNLKKVLTKNWLTLTKDGGIKKWIVYDVDSLDTSSEEETTIDNIKDIVGNIHNRVETESDDDDFDDDINRRYKKYD